jgi:uncharacterized membrane protein
MEWTLLLKLVHVLAAIVAVGANLTYTFWLRYAALERDRLVWTMAGIRRLDNFVATPAYILLLVTGLLMVAGGLFTFQTSWIVASIALYVAVVAFGLVLYAPALKRQLAEAARDPHSEAYRDAARVSNVYGLIPLAAVLLIVTLMVTKPALW